MQCIQQENHFLECESYKNKLRQDKTNLRFIIHKIWYCTREISVTVEWAPGIVIGKYKQVCIKLGGAFVSVHPFHYFSMF